MSRKKKSRSSIDRMLTFKIVDPLIQTALLIYYFYTIDEGGDWSRKIFWLLLVFQVVSFGINYFLPFYKKKKIERWAFALSLVIWLGIYYYVTNKVKEVVVTDLDLKRFAVNGVHNFYLMFSGLLVSVWYFSICFREVTKILKKQQQING